MLTLKKLAFVLSIAVCALSVSSCGMLLRQPLPATISEKLPPLDDPKKHSVVGESPEDVVDLASSGNLFVSEPIVPSDPLPDVRIEGLSFAGANPTEIIRTLLAGTGISFVVRNESASSGMLRHPVTANNISGKLVEVLNRLSDSAGFYYAYRKGVLEITPDMQFIAEIPPVNSLFDSLPQMVKNLGASDVFLDKSTRTLAYRATKQAQSRVNNYLTYIRENRSLIVYDTYIWEVILDDSKSMGVNWNQFSFTPNSKWGLSVSGGSGGAASAPTGSIGLGVTYSTSKMALNLLVSFLQTQGTLKTISQPKMSLLSGGTATFRNGNSINYVSQVGTTTTTNATTTSVTTANILSGLDMTLSGDISDSTVYTSVRLDLNTLQQFNSFTAVGTQLSLPQMENREITTDIRCRSGDMILLAGINASSMQQDDQGVPLPGLDKAPALTSRSFTAERSELVIVLKPRVIRFVRPKDTNAVAAAATEESSSPAGVKIADKAPPPKADPPKADTPKVDAPKADASKAVTPKTDAQKPAEVIPKPMTGKHELAAADPAKPAVTASTVTTVGVAHE